MSDPLDQIDTLLDDILSQGWDDPPDPQSNENWTVHRGADMKKAVDQFLEETSYPPLPQREAPVARPRKKKPDQVVIGSINTGSEVIANALLGVDGQPAFPPEDDTPDTDQDEPHGLFDIGLLSDLATGRKGALEAAQAAGVTTAEVQSQLAIALRDVDPTELAKALGMQAAEQQLKSGAIYGVVLSELVKDMMNGRMTAGAKIDLAKLLASVGKIMPKEDKTVGAGGGFVLNISMGASPAQPITIEAE